MDYTRVSKLVQPGKRLGALLVDENVLTAEELVPAVIGQVRSIVLGLFRRTETWYRFKEEELEQKEAITLDLAVPELILEGVRHVESWRRVSKGVGSLESVYRRAAAREKEWLSSQLDDDVRQLIDMLATPTSLADICTRATLPDFEQSAQAAQAAQAAQGGQATQTAPAAIPESLIENASLHDSTEGVGENAVGGASAADSDTDSGALERNSTFRRAAGRRTHASAIDG